MEVQSDDASVVARNAAIEAYKEYRRPLFVEDTGLFIRDLKGFPGTSASFAFRTIGLEGVLKLMDATIGRSAEFVSAVAFCEGETATEVFTGRLRGTITVRPLGNRGFGFDPIFLPERSRQTLAQMSPREKCVVSHRAIALRELGDWLTRVPNGQRLSA